jgi:hypothetical protein
MSTKIREISENRTARKVVGTLGVLGAAAAVAGLGTYGTFTDSSTPVNTAIDSATLSIDVAQAGVAVPTSTTNFVPGDSLTRAVNLVNNGTAALGSVSLATTATTTSVLTTDLTNGLQMTVKSCSVAWSPTYTCAGTEKLLGSGPVVGNITLNSPASLNPGGTDYVAFTISLPTTADNTFQGKSAALSLVFTGAQRTGTAR